MLAISVPGESPLPGLWMATFFLGPQVALFPLCPSWAGGGGKLTGVSSHKDTHPIGSGPHPMTSFHLHYLLEALFPNTVTSGLRALPHEFGGEHSSFHCRCHWEVTGTVKVACRERSLWLQREGWAGAGKTGSCLNGCCCPGVRNAA